MSPQPMPTKLAPLTDQKMLTEEQKEEIAKDRQRSLLDSLTYDLMNPVILVQKGKQKRKLQKRFDMK